MAKRRIELDGCDLRAAVRAWLKDKGIIPPPDAEIVLSNGVNVKNAGASLSWDAEVSGR